MNLPPEFTLRTKDILKDEFDDFLTELEKPAPISIRANNKIESYQPSADQVLWNNNGYYLPERPLFTADPYIHAGVYYVQEASSMILAKVVEQFFPDAQTVLDLCAAPGGKSTLLSQSLKESALLVSNEIVRSRAYILAENIAKWGNPNVVVTNNKPEDFSPFQHFFDAIVIDAPCSGEGMFRKDPGAIGEWSVANVELCAQRQKEIVQSVWDALKPGGILVYSTCTYNRLENEENVDWICTSFDAEKLRLNIPQSFGITETESGYRFYPHKTKGEGFFISIIRKGNTENLHSLKISNKKDLKPDKETPHIASLLQHPDYYSFVSDKNILRAFPSERTQEYLFIYSKLNFIDGGIQMAEIKGKDYIPAQQLALSKELNKSEAICYETTYDEAIKYLKKEAIYLDGYPKNYVLICYKDVALGWVKNIGNRANNLYPQNWRIRMHL